MVKSLQRLLSIIFLILMMLLSKATLSDDLTLNTDGIKKEDTLVKVLEGIGFKYDDALNASRTLEEVFPLELLPENSYLIMPPLGEKIDTFAVNVDDKKSVLIKKLNNEYFAYIVSTEKAHEIIAKKITFPNDITSIASSDKIQANKNKIRYKESLFVFERGSALLTFLKNTDNKKSNIKKAIIAFRKVYSPEKIDIGSRGKVIKSQNNKLLGFYINVNSKKSVIVYLDNKKFSAFVTSNKEVDKILKSKINYKYDTQKNIQSIRISIFNSAALIIKKNNIKKGSSLFKELAKYEVNLNEINQILNSIKVLVNLKKIKPGTEFGIVYKMNRLFGFYLNLNKIEDLQIVKKKNGFEGYIFKKPFKKELVFTAIKIKKNLYLDAQTNFLPSEIFLDLVRLFSFSIDFQRDIRPTTTFEIMYENLINYNNEVIMPGNILFSKAYLKNKIYEEMYRFENSLTDEKYFNAKGISIRKSLMKTPIDGARLSSGFGTRRHPILGYNKMHKGLDFAAKKGTPIFAAGDGIIERAGNYGAYGRYIRIKHNSKYKTAYAHLSKFAKGIRKGKFVKQGKIIGFVGTSGRSTGPHLHYEVLQYNKQVNPYKLNLPETEKLTNDIYKVFIKEKIKIENEIKKIKSKLET